MKTLVCREMDPFKYEPSHRPERAAKIAIYEGITGPGRWKLLRKKCQNKVPGQEDGGVATVTFIEFFDIRHTVHRKIVIESDFEALHISNRSQI